MFYYLKYSKSISTVIKLVYQTIISNKYILWQIFKFRMQNQMVNVMIGLNTGNNALFISYLD